MCFYTDHVWIVLCLILASWVKPSKWIKGEEAQGGWGAWGSFTFNAQISLVLRSIDFDLFWKPPFRGFHQSGYISVHERLSHVVKHELRGKLGLLLCWLSWLRFPHMYDTTLEVPVKVIQQKSCWARPCSVDLFDLLQHLWKLKQSGGTF